MRTAVVAMCNNRGIGKDGHLPWRLKKEMAHFKRITTGEAEEMVSTGKQNAVVMGRLTWESVPAKVRPLAGRINIIISSTLGKVDGAHVVRSVTEAAELVTSGPLAETVKDVHWIGGAAVYKEALSLGLVDRVYLTRVLHNFDCDVFLPQLPNCFTRVSVPNISEKPQKEDGICYVYEVYDKQ